MTLAKIETAAPPTQPERWTYTRYRREAAENEYFSVIGGERLMSPSPNRWHQTTLIILAGALQTFVKQNELGAVMLAPFDVYFSEDEFIQPDLLFVAKEHADRLTNHGVIGAPDLVVEIISPGSIRADRIIKRDLYAKHGVPEYWIISPTERTVEVLALKGGLYETAGLYEGAEVVQSPRLPGFSILPETLFED